MDLSSDANRRKFGRTDRFHRVPNSFGKLFCARCAKPLWQGHPADEADEMRDQDGTESAVFQSFYEFAGILERLCHRLHGDRDAQVP